MYDISIEFKAVRQSGRHTDKEAKDLNNNEGNDGVKERAANVKTWTLLLNNSANGPIVVNHWQEEGGGGEMKRKETSRNYTTQG